MEGLSEREQIQQGNTEKCLSTPTKGVSTELVAFWKQEFMS